MEAGMALWQLRWVSWESIEIDFNLQYELKGRLASEPPPAASATAIVDRSPGELWGGDQQSLRFCLVLRSAIARTCQCGWANQREEMQLLLSANLNIKKNQNNDFSSQRWWWWYVLNHQNNNIYYHCSRYFSSFFCLSYIFVGLGGYRWNGKSQEKKVHLACCSLKCELMWFFVIQSYRGELWLDGKL